ncbi:MAG: DNA cytosine methyltransferase [Paraburkholderia tropica]|nr:DNA cytosine methyltransferase [Paraburkholderia tropica]
MWRCTREKQNGESALAAYFNEIDPYAAQWLRNLIAAGHIAPGDVDERSIEDVRPDDLRGYTQCHFFAGIGVWSSALRLAGWPDDRPVWTGSCPCQPFSAAGKGLGFADERHLWPAWHHLISECRPPVILGEQVASKDVDPWIDLVFDDLEALGYACGATPFPSAGVGAPHIRDRTYFVADADHARSQGRQRVRERATERSAGPGGVVGIVADANGRQLDGITVIRGVERDGEDAGRPQGGSEPESRGAVRELADAGGERVRAEGFGASEGAPDSAGGSAGQQRIRPDTGPSSSSTCRLAHADGGHSGAEGIQRRGQHGQQPEDGRVERIEPAGPTNGFWRAADWLLCRDEKWRPVEPGTFPLADGAPARVGRLRAYGNAINREAAAAFIAAADEAMTIQP